MTKDKPLYYYNHGELRATIWQFWAWYDGWTGYYWNKETRTLYKNIIPFFPWWILAIHFQARPKRRAEARAERALGMKSKRAKLTKGVKYWKKKAWDEFSKWVRLRDAIRTTGTKDTLLCCTCGKPYPAFGKKCAQAGHFIPGRGHSLLFREQGVHGQCYNCNQVLKGNWVEYEKFMLRRYNQKVVDEEKAAKYSNVKYIAIELEAIYEKYKIKLKELEANNV